MLILPLCVSTMNIIILRTYVQSSIPEELIDSARIDGAGEYRTFFQIVFPLMKPAMAAVGFMMATAFWNDWQNALLFITSDNKKPLQLLLVNIQKSIETLLSNKNIPTAVLAKMQGVVPQNSATMASVIVVIGPIMIAYPFFQKYFIKGLTVGSVKGYFKAGMNRQEKRMKQYICIDIGGTAIKYGVVQSGEIPEIIRTDSCKTPENGTKILQKVFDIIEGLKRN